MNPYAVVDQFEAELCAYTGARFAVTTTSCTMAILLACSWCRRSGFPSQEVHVPKRTYVSVPMSVIHSGFWPKFIDITWHGDYSLDPLPVVDSARWFTSRMYKPGDLTCLSFHWTKTLAIGTGGAILHDNEAADEYLRRARFDGRTPGMSVFDDTFPVIGYHANMAPRDAAEGLSRLAVLPKDNAPLPCEYPDLSKMECFK